MDAEQIGEMRNEIKSYVAKSGWTLTDIVKEMNKTRGEKEQTTTQNISNKLTRGTIKYSECKEIAFIIGFAIKWEPIE
ncbi:MAG: LLM class flavin-dependent oxidoreductase [Acetobacterium woodii]|nr:LLM class flavin-dependent oxidoreductase [Acetobacterium woodii]